MMGTTRIFTYGTLMRGEPNHSIIAAAEFIGPARTAPNYTLVSLGAFPGLVIGGCVAVVGEIYLVTPEILARLDQLEGHPRFYCRAVITLEYPLCDPHLAPVECGG